jgi:hypothetical protein
MLASALNDQLGSGAEWKVFMVREPAVDGVALHVSIRDMKLRRLWKPKEARITKHFEVGVSMDDRLVILRRSKKQVFVEAAPRLVPIFHDPRCRAVLQELREGLPAGPDNLCKIKGCVALLRPPLCVGHVRLIGREVGFDL